MSLDLKKRKWLRYWGIYLEALDKKTRGYSHGLMGRICQRKYQKQNKFLEKVEKNL